MVRHPMARSNPEKEKIPSRYILNVLEEFERQNIELHSLMIAANGNVIFEGFYYPYSPRIPHILHSLTKAFTNIAVGFLVDSGTLSLSDCVVRFFPEYVPADAGEYLRIMTVRDLITMRNGHARMISGNEWRPLKTSWVEAFFREPVVYRPGTVFQYSSANSYILSAIVQKLSGMTTRDFLIPRFFDKLGISSVSWDISPEGICPGGNGLTLCTEDILKLGQFMLQKGKWDGKPILSEEWVLRSLGLLDGFSDGQPKYGYHWNDRGGAYEAGGAFGQSCIIVPDLNLSIAITAGYPASDEKNAYHVLERELLRPLRNDRISETALREKNARLNLLPHPDDSAREGMDRLSHEVFEAKAGNPDLIREIRLEFHGDFVDFLLTDNRGEHRISCGIDRWVKGSTDMTGAYLHHQYQPPKAMVYASVWKTADDSFRFIWRYPEMAFCDTVDLKVLEDSITYRRWVNVNSGALERPIACLMKKRK